MTLRESVLRISLAGLVLGTGCTYHPERETGQIGDTRYNVYTFTKPCGENTQEATPENPVVEIGLHHGKTSILLERSEDESTYVFIGGRYSNKKWINPEDLNRSGLDPTQLGRAVMDDIRAREEADSQRGIRRIQKSVEGIEKDLQKSRKETQGIGDDLYKSR